MEFDKRCFIQALQDVPAEQPLLETPEHSEYLQTHVFDRLSDKGTFNLTELDWNAFDLRHVTPVNYDRQYERVHQGWLQGINAFLRKTPAASLNEKGFF